MNTEEQFHHDKIRVLQARFPGTQDTILALQREYNQALDDFRVWARDHHVVVPKEQFRAESKLVIHKIEWIGPRKIRIL